MMGIRNLPDHPAWAGLLAVMTTCAALPALAQDAFQQHGAHQHGLVSVNVALDGAALRVEIESPADSLIGFEHAPRTDEQRATVDEMHAWLHSGRGMVYVPAAARCQLADVLVHEPRWGNHHHDHDHDHDHDHAAGDGEHQDYRVVLDYRCERPAALHWLELQGLARLRKVQEVRVQVLTPSRQFSQTLADPAARVPLR